MSLDDAIRDDPRYKPAVARTRALLAQGRYKSSEWDEMVLCELWYGLHPDQMPDRAWWQQNTRDLAAPRPLRAAGEKA